MSKQLLKRQPEAGQDGISAQCSVLADDRLFRARAIGLGADRCGIDEPNESNADLEIFAQLPLHFFFGIPWAKNLYGEVGHEVGNRVGGKFSVRKLIPGDETSVRYAHEA